VSPAALPRPPRPGTRGRRRILGVDPGSRATGYGLLDVEGGRVRAVAWGVIRARDGEPLAARLVRIHEVLSGVIAEHHPDEAAVERVFVARDPSSALKLGHARGVVLLTCSLHGVPVHEYSAREIKAAATSYGAASKEQVAGMVRRLLQIRGELAADASDALAAAYCRAVTRAVEAAAPASTGEAAAPPGGKGPAG